ncbi:hypothetical protein GY15_31175 [Delftia sp. 670]|nr:hypothetical protein GY15_31175 [Delftia sp. 670]
MTTQHTDEKKPADAGDVEALKRAVQDLRESPRFQLRLALGKLNHLLRTWMGIWRPIAIRSGISFGTGFLLR